jgi:hypothetical protein
VFKADTASQEVQSSAAILVVLLTGSRGGTIFPTDSDPNFVQWGDIELFVIRDADTGMVDSFDAKLTLKHFKGYQHTTRMVLRYQISGMKHRNNVLFDLPLFLVSHALNVGALDGCETIDDILGDSGIDHKIPISSSFLTRPLVFRGTPKGTSLDLSAPMAYDQFARYHKSLAIRCGLRGENDAAIILYCLRKGTLTRAYESSDVGKAMAQQMAVHKSSGHALESNYVQTVQSINLVGLLGVGEETAPLELDSLSDRRATAKFVPATPTELADSDVQLDLLQRGLKTLRQALENGTDGWKLSDPVRCIMRNA